jgi:hypothetical protein
MSTAGTLLGTGASSTPDVLRPQVRVQATTVKRGTRAKIPFHLADDSGTVAVVARLVYHSTTLLTVKNTFTTVDWGIPFVFWFDVPRQVPTGRYTACVRATDPSGNSAQSCAAVKIR